MRPARRLLLAEDVGDVIGAESARRRCFLDCVGHGFRPVLPNQFEQFSDLTRQRAVGVGHVAQIRFHHGRGTEAVEKPEQSLLRLRTPGRGTLFGQFCFETLRAEGLAAAPGARIADDLVDAVIDGDGTSIGFDRQPAAHIAMGHAVSIAIELQAEIFVHQQLRPCRGNRKE